MPREPKYDILFEPIQLGPKTLRNRFWQVPHCNGAGVGQARHAGEVPRHEGRGWLGRRLHRGVHDLAGRRRHARWSARSSGTTATCATCRRCATRSTSTARWPASSCSTRAGLGQTRDAAPARGRLADPARHHPDGERSGPRSSDEIRDSDRSTWTGCKRARDAPASTCSPFYAASATFPIYFLYPFYNKRTDEYGGSFENRIRFTRELLEDVRDEIDDCAIGIRFSIDTLDEPYGFGDGGIRADGEGRRVHRSTRPPRRLLGRQHRHPELGRGRRLVALLRDQPSGRVHARRRRGVSEARAQRRPLHRSRRHGRGDPLRTVRHHRRGPAVDRRPVPAEEDRGGPARRHPRVHRLQHLRLAVGARRPPIWCTQNATSGEEYRRGWHPERFAAAANADNDVLDRRRRAGRHGVRAASSASAACGGVHLVDDGRRAGRPPQLGDHAAGARRVAARHQLPRDPDRASSTTSSSSPARA